MADEITPLMNLRLPTPGVTKALGVAPPGESWLELLGAALRSIDNHSHAPGYGRPVPSNGIGINSALLFNGYDATGMRSVRLQEQTAAFSAPDDVRCMSVVGGELYYRDGSGNSLQITSGGALNAASIGAIGGDYSTSGASLSYASGPRLFSFESSAGVKAGIATGPLQVFDPVAGGHAVTVTSPSGLGSDYQVTLPNGLPASTKILTMDAAGNIAAVYATDGATLEVVANAMRVKDGGITGAKLASSVADGDTLELVGGVLRLKDLGIGTTKLGAGAVTAVKTDAVSAATPSRLVVRDASGRAQFAEPSATADAATKNYVDTQIEAYGPAPSSLTAATNWSWSPGPSTYTKKAGMVTVRITATWTGGSPATGGTTITTLPAGYRPSAGESIIGMVYDVTHQAPVPISIASSGAVTVFDGSLPTSTNLRGAIVFPANN